jgi:hypothetical protein
MLSVLIKQIFCIGGACLVTRINRMVVNLVARVLVGDRHVGAGREGIILTILVSSQVSHVGFGYHFESVRTDSLHLCG